MSSKRTIDGLQAINATSINNSGTETTGALTVLGTVSCGTNSMTCGALSSTSINNSGTFSCTSSMTCGAMSCGSINSTSFSNSGTFSNTSGMTCGAITCPSLVGSDPWNFIYAPNRKSVSAKAQVITTNGTFNTLLNIASGYGYVRRIWFAWSKPSGQNLLNDQFKITANGAGSPQIGPLNPEFLSGPGWNYGSSTNIFKNNFMQNTAHAGGGTYNITWEFDIPFTNGIKIEYATGSSDNGSHATTIWYIIDYSTGTSINSSVNWVLNGVQSPAVLPYTSAGSYPATTSVGDLVEQTLFDVTPTNQIAFMGGWHWMANSTAQSFLEGIYQMYLSGSGTPSFTTSGTEDYYGSSYYFTDGSQYTDTQGYPVCKQTANYNTSAYRWYPPGKMPTNAGEMKFTWTNGNSVGHPGSSTSIASCFYYYTT